MIKRLGTKNEMNGYLEPIQIVLFGMFCLQNLSFGTFSQLFKKLILWFYHSCNGILGIWTCCASDEQNKIEMKPKS